MIRRDFLRTLLGGGAGSLLVVSACGGDDGAAPIDAPASCLARSPVSVIVGNHGHSMIVTAAEVGDPRDREYDLTGGADHSHSATITEAQFDRLANGMSVTVTSSGAGHTHTINIRCR